MAYGDPMTLITVWGGDFATVSNKSSLIANGNFEVWSNTAAFADGWNYLNSNAKTPTLSRSGGARTGGVGSYFQTVNYGTISVSGLLFSATNLVELHGNKNLPARGHHGRTFTAVLWARKSSSAGNPTVKIEIQELDEDGNILPSSSETWNIPTNWSSLTHSRTLTNNDTAFLRMSLVFTAPTATTYYIDLDDAVLYTTYTFARNPAIPDDQRIISPTRTFARSYDGSLFLRKVGAASARHEKRLHFGMIDLTQYNAFRSLHLLDVPMHWYPWHPHLAAELDVRWIGDFDFSALKYLSLNMYKGTMTLAEV